MSLNEVRPEGHVFIYSVSTSFTRMGFSVSAINVFISVPDIERINATLYQNVAFWEVTM